MKSKTIKSLINYLTYTIRFLEKNITNSKTRENQLYYLYTSRRLSVSAPKNIKKT